MQEIELNEQQTLELLARSPLPTATPTLSSLLPDHPDLHGAADPGYGHQSPQERTAHFTINRGVDSSLAVEAQSEMDISLDVAHYREGSAGAGTAARPAVSTTTRRDGSTQDSPHTLSQLQAHLREEQYQSALGPSLAVLQQQQAQQSALTEQSTPQQLQERQAAYLRGLPPVPRDPEAESAIYGYMKELDRYGEVQALWWCCLWRLSSFVDRCTHCCALWPGASSDSRVPVGCITGRGS